VEPGWLRTDLNITIPDVTVPFVGGLPPGPGALGYDYIFVSGVYQWPTLTGKVLVAGNALIYVTGNIKCNVFTIATNCSVTLYCGGSVSFNDTDNQTQRAQNFQILGLKSCKLLDLDNEFMGSVYAPYASVTFVGQKQIYGSIAADQITLKGGSDLHYDEALFDPNSASQNRGFIVISWVEL
jgi:cytoskeletal protein CcmA (bactofilin family)